MLLLIHQPLLKVALKMKTFSFNAMMKLAQQELLQHLFVYRPRAEASTPAPTNRGAARKGEARRAMWGPHTMLQNVQSGFFWENCTSEGMKTFLDVGTPEDDFGGARIA